jgi:hypothetical protein
MHAQISKSSTVRRVSCNLAGEAVILNTKSGIYFGLKPVGARIWELVQEPRTIDAEARSELRKS